MQFSAFAPFGVFAFTSADSVCKKQYDQYSASMGPAFQGPVQDATHYAISMGTGCAQLQMEASANQRDPLQCTFLLDERERDYQIIPEFGQSTNQRQIVLAAAIAARVGALESVVSAGLTSILGSAFVGWRPLDIRDEAAISADDNSDVHWIIDTPVVVNGAIEGAATSVCWFPTFNSWVAVSATAVTYEVATSNDDGATWIQRNAHNKPWTSICFASKSGRSLLIAVGRTSGGDIQSVMTSDNGETWTLRDAVEGSFEDVALGGGTLVAVGTNCAMYSLDCGVTWADASLDISAHTWKAVAHGNNVWVAVSRDGYVCTSADGMTFGAAVAMTGTWEDVIFAHGVFVASSSTGAIPLRWSADGATWSPCTVPALGQSRPYYSLTYCDGLFVTLDNGPGGFTRLISVDGKTWQHQIFSTAFLQQWNCLAAKANHIIGVSQTGAAISMFLLPQPQISPNDTPIKVSRIWTPVYPNNSRGPIFPGTQTVHYEALLTNGDPIKTGDYLTIEPGRRGLQERVRVIASTVDTLTDTFTFTATFRRAHSANARATTAPWPTWTSTKCHSLVLVSEATLSNRTHLAKINLFMRKVLPATWTWTICTGDGGYTTPYYATTSRIGQATIGGIRETHL